MLADVDIDGDADAVLGDDGQQNRLYLNDGTGRFVDATGARLPADGGRYSMADVLGGWVFDRPVPRHVAAQ